VQEWNRSDRSERHRIETIQKPDLLVFPFGVTVIRHRNADAMVLASALMRGIHPPDNIQNGERPGRDASHKRTG
jgi:hypothetical protein